MSLLYVNQYSGLVIFMNTRLSIVLSRINLNYLIRCPEHNLTKSQIKPKMQQNIRKSGHPPLPPDSLRSIISKLQCPQIEDNDLCTFDIN